MFYHLCSAFGNLFNLIFIGNLKKLSVNHIQLNIQGFLFAFFFFNNLQGNIRKFMLSSLWFLNHYDVVIESQMNEEDSKHYKLTNPRDCLKAKELKILL